MSDAPLPSVATAWVDPKTGQPRPELWAFLNALFGTVQGLNDLPGPFTSNFDAYSKGVPEGGLFKADTGHVRWLNIVTTDPFIPPPSP